MDDYDGDFINLCKIHGGRIHGSAPTQTWNGASLWLSKFVYYIYRPIVTSVHQSTYSPNHATDSNARWLKRRGLGQGSALQASVFRNFHFFWVISLNNLQNSAASAEIPARTKMLNNFLLAWNGPEVVIDHYWGIDIALSKSITSFLLQRPLAEIFEHCHRRTLN